MGSTITVIKSSFFKVGAIIVELNMSDVIQGKEKSFFRKMPMLVDVAIMHGHDSVYSFT